MDIRPLRRDDITEAEAVELARLRTLVCPSRLADDPPLSAEYARAGLLPSVPTYAFDYYGLFDGERMVGLAESSGAVDAENDDVAEVGIWIEPTHLGRDLHRMLFDHIDRIEQARGRTRYWGWGDLNDPATVQFWENEMGFQVALDERVSRCHLPSVDSDLMRSWITRASERASGYHLERVISPMDDQMLGLYAQSLEAMNDAPHDDLDFAPETFDLERAREMESLYLALQSEYRLIFAVETATGELGGYTAVRIPDFEPELSKQNDTVTLADHRNKGLGRWLKATMFEWLRETRPEVEYLETGNAESNRAMLNINEAMGFVDVRHIAVWQRPT